MCLTASGRYRLLFHLSPAAVFPSSGPWAATSQDSKSLGAAGLWKAPDHKREASSLFSLSSLGVCPPRPRCLGAGRGLRCLRLPSPFSGTARRALIARLEGETCISVKTPLRTGCFCGVQTLPQPAPAPHINVNEALRAPGKARLGRAKGGSADGSL